MKINTFLLFSLSFLLSACNQGSVETVASNTVQSSQVFQIYDIEASRSETKVVATFRVGGATGTTLELAAPGKILYNNEPLAKSDPTNLIGTNYRVKGTDYRLTMNKYQPSHEFAFTDGDGKTYKSAFNLLPVEVSANSGLTLRRAQPATIPLSRSLAADETATIAIDSIIDDQIPTADNSVYFNAQRSAIVVTPKYWETKQLKTNVPLQIKVKKSAVISQDTNLGGTITAAFAAAPVYVPVISTKTSAAANAKANTSIVSNQTRGRTAANTAAENTNR